MDLDLQARDGADVQVGDAHGGELAVDRFDGQADGTAALRGARVGGHGVRVQGHEHTAARGADDGLVWGAVVALVAVDPRSLRQRDRQFMDGREGVQAAGQQGEGHGQAVRRADQVQAPAEDGADGRLEQSLMPVFLLPAVGLTRSYASVLAGRHVPTH